MPKNVTSLLIYILLSAWFVWLNQRFNITYGQNLQNTFITLTAAYAIFKVVLTMLVDKNIKGFKERYAFTKALTATYSIVIFFSLATIWAQSVQALFVAYGLIAAGVALALQDVFKNIAGGIMLLLRGTFRVGDRIEIGQTTGDVIDVGVLNSTILEIKNWVAGDQATGRLINIPNGLLLNTPLYNYTKDNLIIWDELMIPITHDSNWKLAQKQFTEIADKLTQDFQKQAEAEISKLSSKYYLESRDAQPKVFLKVTDNWIELYVRYVTLARERRETNNKLYENYLEFLNNANDVNIASTTLDVIGFPKGFK